ncbi:hypothetical protein C7S16_2177 [Burkholderia thailandensis]|uniref:Uncharacterized protein n=1 Tax=Burkholderia thailandensis TaxID=57975 RepID=A0AAW9D567_BURTH|nr:hypothetical protein [Burkholderia thailandensis]
MLSCGASSRYSRFPQIFQNRYVSNSGNSSIYFDREINFDAQCEASNKNPFDCRFWRNRIDKSLLKSPIPCRFHSNGKSRMKE